MRARERLTPCPRHQPPSPAARAAIATIQRIVSVGCSPEELAQARAELDAMNRRPARQGALQLRVRP